MPTKILLQTTIPTTTDDWSIARFGLLTRFLRDQRDGSGAPMYDVTARDRDQPGKPDSVLATLEDSDFSQLWLFAVDTGDGLTPQDCEGISRFRRKGGGLLVTRDHMDLGSSVCSLGGVGKAHYFHTRNLDPDPARRERDDPYTTNISWPNFHSGANGDYQQIEPCLPLHPVLRDPEAADGAIQFFPSHPHEGAVGKPEHDPSARVIAVGRSKLSGRPFNLAVALEPSDEAGPAIAASTFHHFADYNWDPSRGSPSFVSEPPGDGLARSPEAQRSVRRYVSNLALWLGGRPVAV